MAYTKRQIKKMCKGRTSEQQQAIKYFNAGGGCLSKGVADEEFDSMLAAKIASVDARSKALNKIGLDESQVDEIEPVNFEGFKFDEKKGFVKKGKDDKWRSSIYQISWIFFSKDQIYIYQHTFNMDEDGRKEATEEYFYKDITNFSTKSDSIEKEVLDKVSCQGETTFHRRMVDTDVFAIIVPGDKFNCSLTSMDDAERSIQGMKAKLREKKSS